MTAEARWGLGVGGLCLVGIVATLLLFPVEEVVDQVADVVLEETAVPEFVESADESAGSVSITTPEERLRIRGFTARPSMQYRPKALT